jgi:hypothetical protein
MPTGSAAAAEASVPRPPRSYGVNGAVDLVATEFCTRETIDNFAARLEELRLIPGFVMTDTRLRSLGEPQRVFLTHPERPE